MRKKIMSKIKLKQVKFNSKYSFEIWTKTYKTAIFSVIWVLKVSLVNKTFLKSVYWSKNQILLYRKLRYACK